METLEAVRRRLDGAEQMRSIVKTMKSLAAVGIRRYERAAEAMREYDEAIHFALQGALRQARVFESMAGAPEHGPRLVVVFGSDQGLCGQINQRVAEAAIGALDRDGVGRSERVMVAVGARASEALERSGDRIAARLGCPRSLDGVAGAVQDLLPEIERLRAERSPSAVWLFFARRTSSTTYEPHHRRILPVDHRWLDALRKRPWPTRCLPQSSTPPERLIPSLVREYLFSSLYRAQIEALASENASRLASMQAAERNIERRLEDLRAQFRQERQNAITSELMDIVSGFEALGSGG